MDSHLGLQTTLKDRLTQYPAADSQQIGIFFRAFWKELGFVCLFGWFCLGFILGRGRASHIF